jgi:hypothetical protein
LSRDRAEEVDEEKKKEEGEGAVKTQRCEGRITERKGIGSLLLHACICCNRCYYIYRGA